MISKPDKSSRFQSLKIKTSWGPIILSLDKSIVVKCTLPFLQTTPRQPFEVEGSKYGESVTSFFQNLEQTFPSVKKPKGTLFQQAVWQELTRIPRGETRTYSEISAKIGNPNAARAVGTACGANPLPIFIPCHRVVSRNGLGGYGPGLPWKILFLTWEGVL